MAADTAASLQWSGRFIASPATNLSGDKIVLPQSALEQLLSASSSATATPQPSNPFDANPSQPWRNEQKNQLPHPLTFRLVNANNDRVVYAGIREFSAEEGEVELSPFLWQALDMKETASEVTIHARQLPKGTYVKLRPLEAGYDPDDWKALLERHLRMSYTTLTRGEVLVVPGARDQEFRFLIDEFKPQSEGICVVDTDLEVDIEALNEEQARETLAKIAKRLDKGQATTAHESSSGGEIDLFNQRVDRVLPGDYVDYQLSSWPKTQALEIEIEAEDLVVDLLVSPFGDRQRNPPRLDEHVFSDFGGRPAKRIRLEPTNVELEDAEALWISVHAFRPAEDGEEDMQPRQYTLRVRSTDDKPSPTQAAEEETAPNSDDIRCKNCKQWVPQRTLILHENFCLRNNILCPHGCDQVFQKRSSAWETHWHCPHDSFNTNTNPSKLQHQALFHPTSPFQCQNCSTTQLFPTIPLLAKHKTSTCPGKPILCRFCHLTVPQDGDADVPNPEALLSNLTPHELLDGSRTTECHICARITRLRDMKTHLLHHEFEKKTRPKPRVCRNAVCARTLQSYPGKAKELSNDIGLCETCFGPLYVSTYDPNLSALKRRIERRYLSQLLTGCGKGFCKNEFCKSGRQNTGIGGSVSMKDALPLIKPFVQGAIDKNSETRLHFCTEEKVQKRRGLAEMLSAEDGNGGLSNNDIQGLGSGGWELCWCIAALEATEGDLDAARQWLLNWAPSRKDQGV